MPSELGKEGSFGDELEKEVSFLLRQQEADVDREKELNLYRSGSAPPTVEGSLSAVGGLFNHDGGGFMSEEELRSDPAYLSYYYSNVNLNPRLPPPSLSKEDWRSAQRLQGGSSAVGGIGDRRKLSRNDSVGGGISQFSMPPGFGSKKGESESESEKVRGSSEWGGDVLIGLPGLGPGGKQKSLAEIFQDDLGRATPGSRNPSRTASRNAFENSETIDSSEAELAHLRRELASPNPIQSSVNVQSSSDGKNVGLPVSYSYAAILGGSLSRSTTPDPQLIARAPSPCLAPIGGERVSMSEKRSVNSPISFNSVSASATESADLVTALSGLNLSNGMIDVQKHLPPQIEHDADDPNTYPFNLQSSQNNVTQQHPYTNKSESGHFHMSFAEQSAKMSYPDSRMSNGAPHRTTASSNKSYLKGSPTSTHNSKGSLSSHYQHMDAANSSFLNYGLGGYSVNTGTSNMPPLFETVAAASPMASPGMDSRMLGGGLPFGSNVSPGASESHHFSRIGNQVGPLVDPAYLQYLRTAEYAAGQAAHVHDPYLDTNYLGNSYMDLLQKAYLGSMMSPQKSQYGGPIGIKSGGSNHHGYYGTPAYGVGLSYPGSPLASPVIPNSPVGLNMRYPTGMRNLGGGVMGPWHLQTGSNVEDSFASSLLEEFKGNKAKCFELSEIAGHVVEFSADQYGSRFIQQKLETATADEKTMVFEEINPQALTLMTDVFGNYVVQKFFEHGMASQRRELADKLFGNVLTLSLQMYGCRVIQKAIEVVDLDQKIKMVEELDGHIIRCVRDQNGNHVIQKCIECVPEEHIQFIVSTFFGQVVSLSTHPYGCRVIQRILEHCEDPNTQSKVMDEVLGSVSMLAQDQYGNYVVQHVLEHGKPHERSTIIKELAGRIVQMSQQKFASNVVEKCLTFGGPAERQLLVNEMLGSTDENEPLQAMMKDQFANYVVQKVLETCDDQQRELILTRIKVHLNALKKYTYGKHIVARVEKLVVAGERRISAQFMQPA
ncbi:hypothetical protein RHGRI_002485 [Rhododendron griersonianum]|uniref:PUM-HD domain-containing protein n=1 Tax=Rhododendron griersonianum TaxID=479676 RepID=A0AAV6LQD2_9ERIC|nr:hypothetical protein RHGRI_002485 [Rhododendron griersonianum]